MWGLLKRIAKNDNEDEISFIDVKELYDAAYEEKAKARVSLRRFKVLLARAVKLDEAYRVQLGFIQTERYKRAA